MMARARYLIVLAWLQNLKSESRASHFYRKIGLKQKTMRNWKRSIMKQFSNLTIPLLQLMVTKLNLKIANCVNFHSYSKETLTMIALLSKIVQELKRMTLYHGVLIWFMKIKLILRDKKLIVQTQNALDVSLFLNTFFMKFWPKSEVFHRILWYIFKWHNGEPYKLEPFFTK